MKWLKRKELAILLLIFIVVIIIGYFTKFKSLIGINDWKDAASVVTIVGIIMGVYYYHSVIRWNFYRYLADLYYEMLEKGFQNPEFCDPEKTRKYETEWLSDPDKYKYDVFARMCFAYLEDIYDTASKSSLLLNKKYILKLYAPTFERIKIMHGTWFENNRSTLPMKGFFEFIHFNKWRDYLDSSEAEILRWNYLSYDYEKKILNPLQVKEDNPLLEYISGIKEKELIVADVGCGNGSFIANHLAPDYRFKTIYGIDFSDQMMKNAREKCNKYRYLFSWDEIPGNDNSKLIEFLKQKFGIDWVKTAEIEKIDNGNTIKVSTEINHLSLNLNQEKTEVIFKIDDVRTDKFMAKMENGKLNIYNKYSNVKFCQINLKDLTLLRKELNPNKLDMIFSINSLIASNPNDIDMMLCQISLTLKSGGKFIAVLPSFDTVEYLRTLVFKEFKNNREEYSLACHKNFTFKEKILEKSETFYEFGMLSYYFIKLFGRMEYGAWKIISLDRKELGALLDTWKLFYQDRKMNDNKKLYADDGVNIQRFIHEDEIDHMFEKVGLKIQKEKLKYPWNLAKKHNYGYFPDEDKIWDWFVVAEKI